MDFKMGLICGTIASLVAPAAIAAPLAEIVIEGEPLRDRTLEVGFIRVVADYDPPQIADYETENLRYKIYVNDILQAEGETYMWTYGTLSLQNLDNDNIPEVLISTFTGGAHCCTIHTIYSWQENRLQRSQTYPLDGGAGEFKDLDGDGNQEFLSIDNSFLYAFSSYAGSYPPLIILSFQGGQFVDVTRQFPEELRDRALGMYQTVQQMDVYMNGVLAGYVAQKILLGEYREGWQFMLAWYDRRDDWGLNIFDEAGNVIGRHRDYPTALQAFLIDQGYLQRNGQPNGNLDLRDRVLETSPH